MSKKTRSQGGRVEKDAQTPTVGHGRSPRVRVQRALAGVLAGKTRTQACLDAGYSPSTASTQQARTLRRVNGELCEALERKGFGVDALADKIIAGANAEQAVYHDVWEKSPEGTEFQRMRKVEMVPDPRTAALYTRQVIDVSGDAAPVKVEHSGSIEVAEKRKAHAATVNRLSGYLE